MEERTAHGRIDTLERRMDERFDGVAAEFTRIDKRFESVGCDIRELRRDLKESTTGLRGDIKSMQRSMLYGFFTLGGMILLIAGLQVS